MMFPYLRNRMRRRWRMCVFVFLIAWITSLLLCGMYLGECSMEAQIDDVYDNTTVTCAVTNLTGTQSDHLELSSWVVRLFQEPTEDFVHIPETSFLDYVTDIEFKVSMKAESGGQDVDVVGITSLSADPAFRVEEHGIRWLGDEEESIFRSDEAVCVVSKDIYQSMSEGEDGTYLSVKVHGKHNHDVTTDLSMKIVGICTGKQNTVYCPWNIASDTYISVSGAISADCISATIIDNRKIGEFEERCAREYFATVDPYGVPQEWTDSPLYDTYPYAFAIYDDTLNQTIASLQQNQRTFRFCRMVITVLTMGLGFVVGNLSTKKRQNEIALQYVLGLSVPRIFAEAWLEHFAVSSIGFAALIAPAWIIFPAMLPWNNLLIAFAANNMGAAIAVCQVLHMRDALQLMIRE